MQTAAVTGMDAGPASAPYGGEMENPKESGIFRALIVEDWKPMRGIEKKMLQQMRVFELIDEAEDGETAWKMIVESAKSRLYDIVLCDVKMEGLDGIGLLKRCRQSRNFRFVPFLMISASSEEANIVASLGEWGANGFIVKPFSYDVLSKRIDAVLKRAQSPEEALFRHVDQLKANGALEDALEVIVQAERDSRLSLARWVNTKGEILLQKGETEEASVAFKKAMGISNIFVAAHKNYAKAELKLGNMEEALKVLEHVDEISSADNDRMLLVGDLMLKAGRQEAGKKRLEALLKRTGENEKLATLKKVAQLYLEGGLYDDAERVYTATLEYDPKDLEMYNRLGVVLRQQGKYEEAMQCYLKALKNHPDHPGLFYNLGVLYLARKEYVKAQKHLQRALRLNPEFEEAVTMLKKVEQAMKADSRDGP